MIKRSTFKMACVSVSALFIVYVFFFFFPLSVGSFGPLKLGDHTPVTADVVFEYEPFYDLEYKFYIYAVEKNMGLCALGDCGMSGVLVECLGGWLSGEGVNGDGETTDYGLEGEDVETGKSSIIIVADKNKKIIGIYPNYRIKNIPFILKKHRDLSDNFDFCYDTQMPTRR